MENNERLPRPPGQVSVSELVLAGVLCEEDIREDGTVNEMSRDIAEREYRQIITTRPRRRRQRNRPQSANARLSNISTEALNTNVSNQERPESARPRIQEEIQTENITLSEDFPKCCICFILEREYALSPCFHFCVCASCVEKINTCPLCRSTIRRTQRIWV